MSKLDKKQNVVIDCLSRTITFVEPFGEELHPMVIKADDETDNLAMFHRYRDLVGEDRMGRPTTAAGFLCSRWGDLMSKMKDLIQSAYCWGRDHE